MFVSGAIALHRPRVDTQSFGLLGNAQAGR
jgi:hypothetical protein